MPVKTLKVGIDNRCMFNIFKILLKVWNVSEDSVLRRRQLPQKMFFSWKIQINANKIGIAIAVAKPFKLIPILENAPTSSLIRNALAVPIP